LTNNLKLVDGSKGEQLSPGRQAIKTLLDQRQTFISEGIRLRAAIERLSGAERLEATYGAELAAIEASEAADVQEWATSGDGDAPGPRAAERADLEARHSEARAKASAARTAAGQLRQQLTEAERKARGIEAEIEMALLPVLAAEIDPIIAELKQVAARHNELIALAVGIREPMIRLGHSRNARQPDAGREHLVWLEKYDTRVGDLKPVGPSMDQVQHARLEWFGVIAEATAGVVGLDQ
jgi:hypothetical protein